MVAERRCLLVTTSADGILRLFDPALRPGSRLRTLPLGVTPSCDQTPSFLYYTCSH